MRVDAAGFGNAALNREIEGYASLTSVNRGNPIDFFISSAENFTIDVYRMGWYKGKGARLMGSYSPDTIGARSMPTPDALGKVECAWPLSKRLNVPSDWTSGIYLAKLTTTTSRKQSYIIFVVRDDASNSDYLFQSSDCTLGL